MKLKTMISAAMLTLAFGVAGANTLPAAAALEMAKTMDTNKDNMVSKEEFLAMMAKKYDDKMDAMKRMAPAEMAKMVKEGKMTYDGYLAMWKELLGGQ